MAESSTYIATDGAAYEIFLGRWTRRLAPLFIEAMRLPDEGPIIDVGCGTGSCALALAERFPRRQIVGMDVSPAYVDYAVTRAPSDRLRFELGDGCAIHYPVGYFGAALAALVLNFVPDAEQAVREMGRITRHGGVVGACVWDFRGGLVYQRLFWDTAAGIDPAAGKMRDRLFSGALALPDGLAALWRKIGFAEVQQVSLTTRMDYADFDDYWTPLLGGQGPVGTYAIGLAPDLCKRIKEAVRLAFLSGAADGPRSMTATTWAVRGVVPKRLAYDG